MVVIDAGCKRFYQTSSEDVHVFCESDEYMKYIGHISTLVHSASESIEQHLISKCLADIFNAYRKT